MVRNTEHLNKDIFSFRIIKFYFIDKITILKLPLYMLYILNWIFHRSGETTTRRGITLIFQITISTIVHLCGVITVVVFLYGFFSNGSVTQGVPLSLQYVYVSQAIFPVFTACLFLVKSWGKQHKFIDVLTQHKYDITYCKQLVLNVLMLGYVLFALAALFVRAYFFVWDSAASKTAFQFIQNGNFEEILKQIFNVYQIYLFTLYYIFPSFVLYICIKVVYIFKIEYRPFYQAIANGNIYKDGFFEEFAEKFGEKAEIVSELNDLLNLYFGGLLANSLNCLLCGLYMTFLLFNCDVPVISSLSIMIVESINIIIFLVPMAVMHSKVMGLITLDS